MLKLVVATYVVLVLASFAFLIPQLRRRLAYAWLRKVAVLWALIVLAYEVSAPACIYLPSVPAAPVTRRILLGVDQGQLYWLEGTTDRFAFAMGPRWWGQVGHAPALGFERIPPLRLAWIEQRELRWELVRSDGQRTPYSSDGWYVLAPHVVTSYGAVFGVTQTRLRRRQGDGTWTYRDNPDLRGKAIAEALERTNAGIVVAYEHGQTSADRRKSKRVEFLVRWLDLAGEVLREKHYILEDLDRVGLDGFYLSFADGRLFAAQVGVDDSNEARGKVLLLPDSGDAVEICQFTYDHRIPLSFAVSPDSRYFTTGQEVWTMDGSHVMPLVPVLRMVRWQGSSVVGVRAFPLVGTDLLGRHNQIEWMLGWVRVTDPEGAARRFGSDGRGFGSLAENLSFAVRRRPPWHGGIDDSGGSDEIVRVEVR